MLPHLGDVPRRAAYMPNTPPSTAGRLHAPHSTCLRTYEHAELSRSGTDRGQSALEAAPSARPQALSASWHRPCQAFQHSCACKRLHYGPTGILHWPQNLPLILCLAHAPPSVSGRHSVHLPSCPLQRNWTRPALRASVHVPAEMRGAAAFAAEVVRPAKARVKHASVRVMVRASRGQRGAPAGPGGREGGARGEPWWEGREGVGSA